MRDTWRRRGCYPAALRCSSTGGSALHTSEGRAKLEPLLPLISCSFLQLAHRHPHTRRPGMKLKHTELSFSISSLLAERMAKGKQVGSSLLSLGSFSRSASSSSSSFLVTRCPSGTIAQLSLEGVCHWCAFNKERRVTRWRADPQPLNSASLGHGGSPCEGDEPRDRTAICVEDLRHKGKRWATCGLGESSSRVASESKARVESLTLFWRGMG